MKKLLLLFAAVCCMMVANAQTQPDNEIWYTSTDGSVVTPYESSAFKVSIVTNEYDTEANKGCITFNGNVTSIGTNAFYNCVNLTSINLPSTLSSIGFQAFRSCTGLAEIDIPSSLTNFGNYAFQDCTGLTEINIPNGVTSLSMGLFSGCTGLTEINIPSNVTSIGQGALQGCTNLISVTLQNGLTSLGNYTFSGCKSLTEIIIPSSVTSIGSYAFNECTGLTKMIVLAENPPQPNINPFYNVPANILVYVPDKDVYGGNESWKKFNFNFKNLDEDMYCYKQTALIEINIALIGVTLSDNETTAVNGRIQTINNVLDDAEATNENKAIVNNAKYAALSVINLHIAKENTIAEINAAMQGVSLSDDEITAVNSCIQQIQDATSSEAVTTAKSAALAVINLRIAKENTIAEINAAMQGVSLSDDETTAVNSYIQQIQDATTSEAVTTAKSAALAIINLAAIRLVREAAIAAIEEAMQGETSAYLTGLVQEYIDIINGATDITTIIDARDTAIELLYAAMGAYQAGKAEAFGTLGTKQDGPTVEVIDQDDKSVILYNPKKVNFIKVSTEE